MTLTYGYDAAGNVTSEADSLGGLTMMTYDGNQMVSKVYQDATTHLASYFGYDGDGNLLTVTRYAYVSGTPQLAAATQYAYDGGELTSITTQDVASNVLQSDLYSYDAAGRLASQTDDGVITVFGYDATGQLTTDGATGYSYDANGNRTIAGYVTGVDNELMSDGTWNYTYDAVGNTIQKVNIATGETWTYAYDLNNRLVSAVDQQADGTLIQQATYAYDALGDRIQESVTANGVTTTTNYAFDGAGNIWADLNGNNGNSLETRRLFLNAADQVFARIGEAGGTTAGAAWYLTDHEGTIQDIVNGAGAVLDHRTSDAFGNITSETDPFQGDRYGDAGGELDAVTGLVRFGRRQDDTVTGRFTSVDPSGLTPDSNPFRIDGNGPTNARDPSGLKFVKTGVYLSNGVNEGIQHGVPISSTVSVRFVVQAVAAASGCVVASGRAALPRCASNGDSCCGESAPDDGSSKGGSAIRRSSLALAEPSTPGSVFFSRPVSRVRNQVASNARV